MTQPRILVVDDDAGTRASLSQLLTKAGYRVTQASNGAEAVRVWRESGGDLVILDLFMPEKDGIETITELRAHSPGVLIIAMSGGGKEGNRLDLLGDARLLGAVRSITKPFAAAELLEAVKRALNPGDQPER
ncbi:MAG: response regulator [Gemmatimonadales bacterium]